METTTLPHTQTKERIFTLDVIRGFALLGILLMNITDAGLSSLYNNGAIHFFSINEPDYYTWFIGDIFINGKMRCLFSILFGAGVILFTSKQTERISITAAYYRRTLWLMVFGLADIFLVMWTGDILFIYSLAALLIFFFRKLKPLYLMLGAGLIILAMAWGSNLKFAGLKDKREQFLIAEQTLKEGKKLSPELDSARGGWIKTQKNFYPFTAEMKLQISEFITEEIVAKQGGFTETFIEQDAETAAEVLHAEFYYDVLESISAMLIGMALFKMGFLTGQYSVKKYLLIALSCLVVAFPIAYAITHGPRSHSAQNYPNYVDRFAFDLAALDQIPRVLLSVCYAALLIIFCKLQWFKLITKTLSAVGRMAFTNYMLQNIFFTLMFYGFTLNKFMAFTRIELYYIVAIIWLLQALFSLWWLKRYNMGPLEWLWRSLTYWKMLPNKIKK